MHLHDAQAQAREPAAQHHESRRLHFKELHHMATAMNELRPSFAREASHPNDRYVRTHYQRKVPRATTSRTSERTLANCRLGFRAWRTKNHWSASTYSVTKTGVPWRIRTDRAGDYVTVGERSLRRVSKVNGTIFFNNLAVRSDGAWRSTVANYRHEFDEIVAIQNNLLQAAMGFRTPSTGVRTTGLSVILQCTIFCKIITVLTRYRPIVLELK